MDGDKGNGMPALPNGAGAAGFLNLSVASVISCESGFRMRTGGKGGNGEVCGLGEGEGIRLKAKTEKLSGGGLE